MSTKILAVAIAAAILFLSAGEALARRVNHDVTPANIDKLPFKASAKIKDVEKFKQVEITIAGIVGNVSREQPSAPGGWLRVIGNEKRISLKPTTVDGMATFTFQIGSEQLEKARFEFVEDAADWSRPFPTRGDLYQFELKEFVGQK